MLFGLIIFIAIITTYWILVKILEKKEILEKYQMTLWGPIIMWRTQKGRNFLKKLSKKKNFWKIYGNISVGICIICMILFTLLLLWSATLVLQIEPSSVKPEYIIGIPGVNPLIPIWYGILALAVAMIVHESAHGILSMIAKVKVKSLGLLLLVFPIGAFVEPDEDKLAEVSKKKRSRMFAVGPATNIIIAIVCALIFSWMFMGSVEAKREGVIIGYVFEDSSADEQGIEPWMQIIEINGIEIKSVHEYNNLEGVNTTQKINIKVYYDGEEKVIKDVISGIVLLSISEDGPAEKAGIKKGSIITSIDNKTINNESDFEAAMNNTRAGSTIPIEILSDYNEEIEIKQVTLDDKYEAYKKHFSRFNKEKYKKMGYLGVGWSYLGINVISSNIVSRLAHPYSDVDSSRDIVVATLSYISLPFTGISPFPNELTSLYQVDGFLSSLPVNSFWIIANIFYWLFWLNLMVGITNSLPAVPLDGGYIFKDGIDFIFKKFRIGKTNEKRENIVKIISRSTAYMILFLILWQIIGPRVGALI